MLVMLPCLYDAAIASCSCSSAAQISPVHVHPNLLKNLIVCLAFSMPMLLCGLLIVLLERQEKKEWLKRLERLKQEEQERLRQTGKQAE